MGAAVNLASRLEGLNKYLGTEILVSEATKDLAGDNFLFRYAGRVLPKGTTHSAGVYELLGLKPGAENGHADLVVSPQQELRVKEWETTLSILRNCDYEKAITAFEAYIVTHGPDPLADYYKELSRKFILNPPAENWQGEIVFNAK